MAIKSNLFQSIDADRMGYEAVCLSLLSYLQNKTKAPVYAAER